MQRRHENNEVEEEELLVVSNSSVIIALAQVCRLDLLEKLFREILVPKAVWREATVEGKPGSEKVRKTKFIHIERVRSEGLALLLKEFVDNGEAEAIALALEVGANILLVDDRDARDLAKKLGLQVMGTLGVIALAKYRGLIQEAKPIIDRLVESGFWISRRILEQFLRELDEL